MGVELFEPTSERLKLLVGNPFMDADIAVGANINANKIGTGVIDNTEFNRLNGITSALEEQGNKGAVSGYAGLGATQELLLTNFPSGAALQVLSRNAGNTALEFSTPGAASQTPWTQNIDADGFDLFDLSNILFRNSTGPPTATDRSIHYNDTEGMVLNALTGDFFQLEINAVQEYRFTNTQADFNTNNVVNMGTLNTHTIPGGTSTFAIFTDNLSVFAATTSAQLAGVISDETGSGLLVFGTSPTLITPALGTPSTLVLTNATGLPIATGLAVGTSADLAGRISNETGTGFLVFATSPTFITPILGTPSSGTLNMSSITLSGTKAQFDTALSDDDFAYIGQANVFTEVQVIETTVNPPLQVTRSVTGVTNAVRNVQKLRVKTDVNMVDGFGPQYIFEIEDDTTIGSIVILKARRNGGDSQGFFTIGTPSDFFGFGNSGDMSIVSGKKIYLDGTVNSLHTGFGDTSIRESSANVIAIEAGGTDQFFISNDIETPIRGKFGTKAGDLVVGDLAAGQWTVSKNTTSGALKVVANDGGTIKSVTLT